MANVANQTVAERLTTARRAAGYASAADAARAMGIALPTYTHHENGTRGISREAGRYARFFRVSLDWLLRGVGEMTGGGGNIPLMGTVGAGAGVEPIGDSAAYAIDDISLPEPEHLGALVIKGESQYPRYLDGEIIIYDRRPRSPSDLINRFAVVDCVDGRRMIKRVQRGRRVNSFNLWSHNAPEEENVEILAVYQVVGTLT